MPTILTVCKFRYIFVHVYAVYSIQFIVDYMYVFSSIQSFMHQQNSLYVRILRCFLLWLNGELTLAALRNSCITAFFLHFLLNAAWYDALQLHWGRPYKCLRLINHFRIDSFLCRCQAFNNLIRQRWTLLIHQWRVTRFGRASTEIVLPPDSFCLDESFTSLSSTPLSTLSWFWSNFEVVFPWNPLVWLCPIAEDTVGKPLPLSSSPLMTAIILCVAFDFDSGLTGGHGLGCWQTMARLDCSQAL